MAALIDCQLLELVCSSAINNERHQIEIDAGASMAVLGIQIATKVIRHPREGGDPVESCVASDSVCDHARIY